MKKLLALLLVISLGVGLCACGKSAEAAKADELILAIGEVTLDSEDTILAAQIYYDTLTDAQKAEVENYGVLEKAKNDLDALKAKELEYQTAYDAAKEFEAQNLLDEAYAEYKKVPVEYKDTAQRVAFLEPYVGLTARWQCESESAVASNGKTLSPCIAVFFLNPSSIEADKVVWFYSGGHRGETQSIFHGAPDVLYSILSGDMEGKSELLEDGSLILGTAHGFTAAYGSMDMTFKITPEGKLEVEYKRTVHTYNAGVERYDVTTVVFTYAKVQ